MVRSATVNSGEYLDFNFGEKTKICRVMMGGFPLIIHNPARTEMNKTMHI